VLGGANQLTAPREHVYFAWHLGWRAGAARIYQAPRASSVACLRHEAFPKMARWRVRRC
jgi:hypothetical protein